MGRSFEVRKASMAKTAGAKIKVYSKYGKEIYVCAKNGGTDPDTNLSLRRLMEKAKKDQVVVQLKRNGAMPMPIDLAITKKNGEKETIHIPLRMMRGSKIEGVAKALPAWPWTHPTYEFTLDLSTKDLESLEIDPSQRMADINRNNNVYPFSKN